MFLDAQFNLQIEELVSAQADVELWKRDVLSPLLIEVYAQLAELS